MFRVTQGSGTGYATKLKTDDLHTTILTNKDANDIQTFLDEGIPVILTAEIEDLETMGITEVVGT